MAEKNTKRILKRIYEIITTVIIVFGVILAVMYLRGIRLYHVKSGSMGDLLPVGCVCFVDTHYDYEKIKTGDVIAFRVSDDMLVTHRAVSITEKGVYTQGDENDTVDPDPVTKQNYIGKTFYEIPHIGAALDFLHSVTGMILLAVLFILLVISGFFYKKNKN